MQMGKELPFFEQANNETTQIAFLSSGEADAFIKLLIKLSDFTNKIPIRNSRITILGNTLSLIDVSVNKLMKKDNVNMDFFIDESLIESLKKMKGNSEILILDDIKAPHYTLANKNTSVNLSKIVSIKEELVVPDLSENNVRYITDDLVTDEGGLIENFKKNQTYTDIFVFGNQIGRFEWEGGKHYCPGESSMFEYRKMSPAYIFRSYKFLPLVGELVTFSILNFRERPNFYFLKTFLKFGFNMELAVYEVLNLIGGSQV
jgi:hypothetical protein